MRAIAMVLVFVLMSVIVKAEEVDTLRTWTSRAGSTIEATLLSHSSSNIILKAQSGKVITVQARDLSDKDQQYVQELAWLAKLSIPKGKSLVTPLIKHMFPTPSDYFEGYVPQRVYRAYKEGKISKSWEYANRLSPEECVSYVPSNHSMTVYIPADYTGAVAYGVYLHIQPNNNGMKAGADYQALMDKYKLILISPNKTSNNESSWRRIALALDSLATIKHYCRIDESRVFVGGTSGGGHIAMMCHMIYPEYFSGSISHAAQSYLPDDKSTGHFPGLNLQDTQTGLRKEHKWAVISGEKDSNYKEIQETSEKWHQAGFPYKFFDVKGMGHSTASASALEPVLVWLEEQKK